MGILGLDPPPRHQARTRLYIWAPGLAALPAWPKVKTKTPVPFSPLGRLKGLEVVYFEPKKHSNYTQITAPFLTTLLTHPIMVFRHDSLQHFQRLAVSATS